MACATSSLSPVVMYHGLGPRYLLPLGLRMRPQLNGGTLGGRMDLATTFDEVVKISVDSGDASAAWVALVTYLETVAGLPLPDLRNVDVMDDVRDIQEQLEQVIQAEPPNQTLNAVYFGLFDKIDDDENRGIGYYVAGVKAFDPQDGDSLCDHRLVARGSLSV